MEISYNSDEEFKEDLKPALLQHTMLDIGKDMLKYFPSKLFGSFGNLVMVAVYTKILSPDQYGIYMVSTAVLSFLCIIFSDWIGVSGLRFFTEFKAKGYTKPYFSTLLFLLASNLAILFIACYFGFNSITSYFKIPSYIFLAVLFLIIPVAIRALLFQILRAQIQPLDYSISVVSNQIITVFLSFLIVKYFHLGGLSLLIGMSASIIFIDIIMFFQCKLYKTLVFNNVDFSILKEFYKYGLPISLAGLGMWILTQSNRFVLQHYKGSYFNGILGVGFNLTFSLILPLFAIITIAAVPRLFNMHQEGKDVNPIITKLTEYYFVFFTPIILILCLYPYEITRIFSSKEYTESYILIPFLAVSIFIFGLTEYTTIQYHIAKKTYIDTFAKLASGILGLILSIILIPKYNLLAVGISTLISNFAYFLLTLIIRIENLAYIPPIKYIIKVLTAILSSAAIFYILKGNDFQFIGVISAYIIVLLLLIKADKIKFITG
jgi:O-antigen/teichoic acid export membrane protein